MQDQPGEPDDLERWAADVRGEIAVLRAEVAASRAGYEEVVRVVEAQAVEVERLRYELRELRARLNGRGLGEA